ncbi:exodeoxyribonuclease VII large subunit, partial [Staphylococcus epidermidis]|nr:exodeoxyribonuclease VII large subunit [Staphylococcus epidermidis]
PTQAAVIATPDQYELIQQIHQYRFSLTKSIKQLVEKQHKQLDYLSSYYKFKQPTLLYDQQIQRRDDLEKKLTQRLTLNIEKNRNNITVLRQHFNIRRLNDLIVQYQKMSRNNENRLINLTYNLINHNKANLKNKIEQLNQLSPTNTMLRGYSIVNKDNKVITSTHDLNEQDEITLSMKDGNIDAIVKKVRCEDE